MSLSFGDCPEKKKKQLIEIIYEKKDKKKKTKKKNGKTLTLQRSKMELVLTMSNAI